MLVSASEIWAQFVKSRSVLTNDYDADLVSELRDHLGIPGEGDFSKQLEVAQIAPERFIPALLSALAPFALMMSELCAFFERHDVTTNGAGLSIAFDFNQADSVNAFDLKHFRKWLVTWSSVWETEWDCKQIWKPHRLLSEASRTAGVCQLPDNAALVRQWLIKEDRKGEDLWSGILPDQPLPPEIDERTRSAFNAVRDLVDSVMRQRSLFFKNRNEAE